MDNYGEELVYWYLRLNGFFPIPNFVMHDKVVKRRGETDFLAIKPANAKEIVDGVKLEFDEKLLESVEMDEEDYSSKKLFVMAEVSLSSNVSEKDVKRKFLEDIIKYNLQRLGIDREIGIDEIFNLPYLKKESYAVAKLFFLDANLTSEVAIVIPFSDAKTFVEKRMGAPFKKSGWDLFPSNVIQGTIINQKKVKRRR